MHRLPLAADARTPTVLVRTHAAVLDARDASDLIARVTGEAHWRKLYVEKARADVDEARELCRGFTRTHPRDLEPASP
jgi:hypothetical protein